MKSVPKTCEETMGLLSDYSEGLLSTEVNVAVERHLSGCSLCKTEATLVGCIVAKLQQIDEYPAPPELCRRVMHSAFGGRSAHAPSFLDRLQDLFAPRRTLVAVGTLACVLLLAFLPVLYRDSGPDGQDVAVVRPVRGGRCGGLVLAAGEVTVDRQQLQAKGQDVPLEKETAFAVQSGSTALLNFADGSRVVAAQGAEVSVSSEGLALEHGRLDLNMERTGVGFVVETPHADIVVIGTVYSVEVDDRTMVRVEQGRVSVESHETGEEVLVRAGQRVTVLASGHITHGMGTSNSAAQAGQSEDTRLGIDDEN